MDQQELLNAARQMERRVHEETANAQRVNSFRFVGLKAEVQEFLRRYAGDRSAFYKQAQHLGNWEMSVGTHLRAVMHSFVQFVEAGLIAEVSPERRAQLDVVSDFLEQAHRLAADKKAHPAMSIFLTGATLEEFFRTWVDDKGISLGNRKPGLQSYATVLRDQDLITKQDLKDITSWAGLRNAAAHGQWEEVNDRQRAFIMLESVNLFLRKCGA